MLAGTANWGSIRAGLLGTAAIETATHRSGIALTDPPIIKPPSEGMIRVHTKPVPGEPGVRMELWIDREEKLWYRAYRRKTKDSTPWRQGAGPFAEELAQCLPNRTTPTPA